ncbi:hypothetical protein DL546_001160 [Coniochaeta pulveracea]|uniref:Uncharacterized protein n=1 Tax=Coniochaeta pulveracea TaxID=177199 RepID=A0A420XW53_9PEZI|nr:hypothetical protein DL546_001160 [Coniochaeta pulveracea]
MKKVCRQQAGYYYSGDQADPARQHLPIYYYGGPPVEPQRHSIYYYGGPANHPETQPDVLSGRSSRDSRESSNERGTSAPPPLGDNPWDIHYGAWKAPFSSLTEGAIYRTEAAIDPWKSLPDIPSQSRSDEEDMSWDVWSGQHGYDPDGHPEDEEDEVSDTPDNTSERPRSTEIGATSPTDVSTFSIGPTGPPYRPGDPGRIKELAGLSSAMVTVDNGFENQWWYQGGRESVVTGEALGFPPPPRLSRNSLGWAVAATSDFGGGENIQFQAVDVASPSTAQSGGIGSSDTPVSSYQSLTRSLTTRSDELFFDRRRRRNDGMVG